MTTKIEWCDESWNPIKMRCTKVSEGCANCYADRLLSRNLPGFKNYPKSGDGPVYDFDAEHQLSGWRKPRRVFVMSMGDLFHPDIDDDAIFHVLNCHALGNRRHTLMILTKRPDRMRDWYENNEHRFWHYHGPKKPESEYCTVPWPDPNVWIGVTAENQRTADERIPILLDIPAAVHFVSVEPMLGYVDLELEGANYGRDSLNEKINWVICGAETGSKARPMNPDWALSLKFQCEQSKTPFFFKKWSRAFTPANIMPREFPL